MASFADYAGSTVGATGVSGYGVSSIWGGHTPGKYKWEPCDIATLKRIFPDNEIDAIVEKDVLSEKDVDVLVDWVLHYKKTLGVYRDS